MAGVAANFAPLSPVSFLHRAKRAFANRPAIVYGDRQYTYAQFFDRVGRLAGALQQAGVRAGDCVAVMAPNIPQMLEAHYAIPSLGALINPLNPSLDRAAVAFALKHGEARLVICDRQHLLHIRDALQQTRLDVPVIVINDGGAADTGDGPDYEEFIDRDSEGIYDLQVSDELQPLSLLYTSGTTAQQKAVTYIHRGAYLAALSNALSFGLDHNSVYLWTWPMFHSHGLSFVWAVTAVGGTHVCVRDPSPADVFDLLRLHRVTHFCMAPTAMNVLANDSSATEFSPSPSPHDASVTTVKCIIGGAAPASASIARLEAHGIEVIHQYGSTECYGPVTVCWRRHSWQSMTAEERYSLLAKQGSASPVIGDLIVADLDSMEPVPTDGITRGEILVRGNTALHGYYGDPEATEQALAGGWFHTGDIAAWHPDGSVEIKDRSADLIISGGGRISSVEIDEILYQHPAVLEAAVVAAPDEELAEVPIGFVTLRTGHEVREDELQAFCRTMLPEHKIPRRFEFRELPRTATGKIKKSELRKLATPGR